jgi:hypothetical protein
LLMIRWYNPFEGGACLELARELFCLNWAS